MGAALAEEDGLQRRPLGRAAMCRQPEGAAADGVRLLLAAGADATAKDSIGLTMLHFAAIHGPDDPSLAGLLLGAGCDPAATANFFDELVEKTALDLAKRYNKPRMAALLEAAAADPEATLAPFRAELATLRQQGMAYVASKEAGGAEPEPEPDVRNTSHHIFPAPDPSAPLD